MSDDANTDTSTDMSDHYDTPARSTFPQKFVPISGHLQAGLFHTSG
jgi:hypothetical protein